MANNKLDLLKKLTRLANNNPNEHEANLAARRACKLLEEMNWSLTEVKNSIPGIPNYKPSPAQEEFYRKKEPAKSPFNDDFYHVIFDEFIGKRVNYAYDPANPNWKPKKDKRTLNCIDCKQDVETTFVGNPGAFSCGPCQWKAYQKTKGENL